MTPPTSSASPAVRPGHRFGPYEVLAPLSEGGMGSVHLARTSGRHGRLFALKVEHDAVRASGATRGLAEEARIGAAFHDAHLVPAIALVTDASRRPALVMDYVRGVTLGRLVRGAIRSGSTLPSPVVLRVVSDVLLGLSAMHGASSVAGGVAGGVVHRDVAPSNVLIGEDGVSRLLDFGIALPIGDEGRLPPTVFAGRHEYMAPERFLGDDECDPRSDLFAVGVLLWETLTSKRLFRDASDEGIRARALAHRVPSLADRRPDAVALDSLVRRALAPSVRDRFATADAFLDAIDAVAPSVGGLATSREVARALPALAGDELELARSTVERALARSDGHGATVDDEPTTVNGVALVQRAPLGRSQTKRSRLPSIELSVV